MVPAHHVRLHDVPQHALPANGLHDLLIPLLLALGKAHLRLCHHPDVLALVRQVSRLDGIVLGQAPRQLFRALAGCFHIQRTCQHTAPGKSPLGRLAAQLGQFGVQLHGLVRIYLVLHIRSCRCPGVRAIHPVCTVGLRVNAVRAKHQRDGAILTVSLPGSHHRNGGRGHPA